MTRMLCAAALVGLLATTEAHLSVVCTSTSKQQPNTFAFWFITYDHSPDVSVAPGTVFIEDPSARVIQSSFSNFCKPSGVALPEATGETVQTYEDLLKGSCLGMSDPNGKVPIFADSAVECYNPDNNNPLPDYAVGLRGAQVIQAPPQRTKMTDFYFVVVDNQFVQTGSYRTWFTGTDQNMDPCPPTHPCSLATKPWTFEISVITGPPRCLTAPPSAITANVVPESLVSCDGGARVIEAGALCHAQCMNGYAKVGLMECVDNGDGTADWTPSFACTSTTVCKLPSAADGNNAAIDSNIVGVSSPCATLNPAGTTCQYTCAGFENQQSVGYIMCDSNENAGGTGGLWIPDPNTALYDGCVWTAAPTPTPTVPVPAYWETGCVSDNFGNNRLFPHLAYRGDSNTIESCVTRCHTKGYTYAGVQFGQECWCGNSVAGAVHEEPSQCEGMACTGDTSTKCGRSLRMKVYQYTMPAAPHTPVFEGCYQDSNTAPRRLPHLAYTDSKLENVECATVCQLRGYKYAGTQNGEQCWCGNDLSTSTRLDPSKCNVACAGDNMQKCGGSYRNTVYSLAPLTTPMAPVLEGCFIDSPTHELPVLAYSSASASTVEECTKTCRHNGFTYAGLQADSECYCGNDLSTSARTALSECDDTCTGNSMQLCGGSFRNRVYAVGPVAPKDAITYVGCFTDQRPRNLPFLAYVDKTGNTAEECARTCQHSGYLYAGAQFGKECWCGNADEKGTKVDDSKCRKSCPGDSTQKCGHSWLNSIWEVADD